MPGHELNGRTFAHAILTTAELIAASPKAQKMTMRQVHRLQESTEEKAMTMPSISSQLTRRSVLAASADAGAVAMLPSTLKAAENDLIHPFRAYVQSSRTFL